MLVSDQLQRVVAIPDHLKKIVSLVPSQTELLCTLGLEDQIAGITKFCIHPDHVFRSKTRVGGTKNADIEKIKTIAPDLIIANKEENEPSDIEKLEKHFPVWVSDVRNLDGAIEMIKTVGHITGKSIEAEALSSDITKGFTHLRKSVPLKVIYLIWNNPYMTIGSDTFIHDIISRCGWINAFGKSRRYPMITDEDIYQSEADIILLSSEPFPFNEKHAALLTEKFRIPALVVDGEFFSWYGSRLTGAPGYLNELTLQAERVIEEKSAKT